MRKFKPDLVIGMGGFVSAPVVLMANFMGIDSMIHEQNVVPGLSTQFLSRFAGRILYSYKESLPFFTIPEKDLATVVLMIALIVTMLFVAGADMKYLLILFSIGAVFALVLLYAEPYRLSRISIWLETFSDRQYVFSDSKRQIMNSIYAISSGELIGKGIGMSDFSKLRLPEAYSDFIFSIVVEEFGFLGLLGILTLYAFLVYRLFKIAIDCDDVFGFTIASGTGILILLQVIINVGVALAILPTTGITLPFISKGGTSLVVLLLLIGVVLNISSSNKERKYNIESRKERT